MGGDKVSCVVKRVSLGRVQVWIEGFSKQHYNRVEFGAA